VAEIACGSCFRGRGVPPFTCPSCKTTIAAERLAPRKKAASSRSLRGSFAPMSRERFDQWVLTFFTPQGRRQCCTTVLL
jgi:hypothetical protein